MQQDHSVIWYAEGRPMLRRFNRTRHRVVFTPEVGLPYALPPQYLVKVVDTAGPDQVVVEFQTKVVEGQLAGGADGLPGWPDA
jgi:hypothetical protein